MIYDIYDEAVRCVLCLALDIKADWRLTMLGHILGLVIDLCIYLFSCLEDCEQNGRE